MFKVQLSFVEARQELQMKNQSLETPNRALSSKAPLDIDVQLLSFH